jgi:hypothetical protein
MQGWLLRIIRGSQERGPSCLWKSPYKIANDTKDTRNDIGHTHLRRSWLSFISSLSFMWMNQVAINSVNTYIIYLIQVTSRVETWIRKPATVSLARRASDTRYNPDLVVIL